MRRSLKSLSCLGALAGVLYLSAPVSADILLPGTTVSPITGTIGNVAQLAFTPVQNWVSPTASGTVQAMVVTNDSNPFGADKVSFLYHFTVASGEIEHLTGGSFAGFQTDVAQDPDFNTPTTAATSANRTLDGKVVSFNFNPSIMSPGGSYDLLVNTDATSWVDSFGGLIDGTTANFNAFAPSVQTPEPASAIIMGLFAVPFCVGGIRRRFSRSR